MLGVFCFSDFSPYLSRRSKKFISTKIKMKKIINDGEYYKLSDISLCAVLCYHGYQISFLERENEKKVVFVIRKDSKLENIVGRYFAHRLRVDPLTYFGFLKEVKGRIYNQ